MFKGIVFDAYGTLFDVFSVAEKCENEYPGRGNELVNVWRDKQLEYSWLQTLMGRYKSFWEITKDALVYSMKSLGILYNSEKINKIMNSYYNLNVYLDVFEALEKFKTQNLIILTNGNSEMIDKLIVDTGINRYIDKCISADTIKLFKPRPEVYQLALNYFAIEKKDILFVSSNAWDIAGAKSFGFSVGWINRFNKSFDELGIKADYIVSDLLELAEKVVDK